MEGLKQKANAVVEAEKALLKAQMEFALEKSAFDGVWAIKHVPQDKSTGAKRDRSTLVRLFSSKENALAYLSRFSELDGLSFQGKNGSLKFGKVGVDSVSAIDFASIDDPAELKKYEPDPKKGRFTQLK